MSEYPIVPVVQPAPIRPAMEGVDGRLVAFARALAAFLLSLIVPAMVDAVAERLAPQLDAIAERLDRLAAPPTEAPALLSANAARAHCGGVAASTWADHNASGAIPAPVHIGKRVFWRRADLDLWIAEGCPGRAKFDAIAKTRRR